MMLFGCSVGMLDKNKKGLGEELVDVSLGFLIDWFRITQYITPIGMLYKNGLVEGVRL